MSDRSEKAVSEDNAVSSQDVSRERQQVEAYSDVEEDEYEDDGVLTRQHVSPLLPQYNLDVISNLWKYSSETAIP